LAWQAAIAHIKQNYTLCEKGGIVIPQWPVPLYQEAK
jgi:hypothetical protein